MIQSLSKKIKIFFKRRVLGYLAYYVNFFLKRTVSMTWVTDPEYQVGKQYLFAFWHGKQWLPVLALTRHSVKRAVLVSTSGDGDLLALCLRKLGYEIIRGSSRHQNISALSSMVRKLKMGYSLGFGIDGPVGPIHKVKPGMTYLAQKFQIPIIPVGSAFACVWVFKKAWDKYEIPKPFSKAVFYLGKPFMVESGEDLEQSNRLLEEAIIQAESKAKTLL